MAIATRAPEVRDRAEGELIHAALAARPALDARSTLALRARPRTQYASEEKWAEQTAADLVLRAFDKYQQGGSPVETTRCKSTPTPAEIVPATPARQFVPEPAEEMATPLAVNKSMQEELSVLSAKLATAEKQTVELRREEVDKAAHIAALTAQHEVEMVDLQKQLKAKQQELELELAKAKNAPTPKKSKICEIQ